MARRDTLSAMLVLLLAPGFASAADVPAGAPSWLPGDAWWAVGPFVLLLLAIAVLPLVADHFWHRNRNKTLVAAVLAAPVVFYVFHLEAQTNGHSTHALEHALREYVSFILLLAALYTVSGGIVLHGDLRGTPLTNAAFLGFGAVLANLIGTTGASMLLIRPVLRINSQRRHVGHIPIFFIFLVSNLGGLLTPLGDPPLFLGFLHQVPFAWTFSLWKPWLVANSVVLFIFLVWDTLAYWRESPPTLAADRAERQPLRVDGLVNLFLLAGILLAVLLQSKELLGEKLALKTPWPECLMAGLALLSLLLTPRGARAANQFSWGPILEVAILFAGIFITMVPALELLRVKGPDMGVSEPWQFFWLTGGLSSFLDNAPTYMTFATMAAGSDDFSLLVHNRVPGLDGPLVLAAISCGAVFMGANTYIGNGPNFMVKAIADETGVKMPSFFGYMLYSGLILLPTFALITYLFFRPM